MPSCADVLSTSALSNRVISQEPIRVDAAVIDSAVAMPAAMPALRFSLSTCSDC